MLRTTLSIAVAATAAAFVSSPVRAGAPCWDPCDIAGPAIVVGPPIVVYEPYQMPRIYAVDQGPVYSGPGIYTKPTVVMPRRMPRYPYVRRDYPEHLPPYIEPLRVRAHHTRSRRVRFEK
jgi:hypothetical protein